MPAWRSGINGEPSISDIGGTAIMLHALNNRPLDRLCPLLRLTPIATAGRADADLIRRPVVLPDLGVGSGTGCCGHRLRPVAARLSARTGHAEMDPVPLASRRVSVLSPSCGEHGVAGVVAGR